MVFILITSDYKRCVGVGKQINSGIIYRSVDNLVILLTLYIASFYSNSYNTTGYMLAGLSAVILFGLVGRFTEIYASWGGRSFVRDESVRVLGTWLLTFMLLIFIAFTTKSTTEFSRIILMSWLFVTPTLLVLNRYLLRQLFAYLKRLGVNNRRVAIVGMTEHGLQFAHDLENNPDIGYHIAGFYDQRDQSNYPEEHKKYSKLGNFEQLIKAARSGKWDQIYVALPLEERQATITLLEQLSDSVTPVRLIPDYFTSNLLKKKYIELVNTPILCVHETSLTEHNVYVKRAEDIFFASLIVLIISPILLGVALAIKLTSRGPVIFKQKRHGAQGEQFTVWKFRSMTVCEDGDTVKQATKNDCRVTRLGGFLRRTSLDELPQFFNVLQGHMSIVGPRPHAVAHNEYYSQHISGYMLRHFIKPGITGWAQINGWRGETDQLYKMEKRVEYDLEYIRRWSLWMDVKIILLSVFKGFSSKNAY